MIYFPNSRLTFVIFTTKAILWSQIINHKLKIINEF